jgi:RNA-binding protein
LFFLLLKIFSVFFRGFRGYYSFTCANNTVIKLMPLTEQQKRELRQRGHGLKPVVSIGNAGLNAAVIREIDLSLAHHELMKVRIGSADRETKQQLIDAVCKACNAELVQAIGHIALLYREKQDQPSGKAGQTRRPVRDRRAAR